MLFQNSWDENIRFFESYDNHTKDMSYISASDMWCMGNHGIITDVNVPIALIAT
jgi:hypothetical protein